MIIFLRILMFVPFVLFAAFLALSVVFAIKAAPKKGNPVDEKHKSAKKKSNIFAAISALVLVLGIVSALYLNSYILELEAKNKADSMLFGGSDTESSSIELSENQQKMEMLKKYRDMLNNGETLRANEIDVLDYLVDELANQIITSTVTASNNILTGYTSAAPEVGADIDNSVIDSLSGFSKIVVESVSEARQTISDYLSDIRGGESVSAESTAECVKEIDCILAYAETSQ